MMGHHWFQMYVQLEDHKRRVNALNDDEEERLLRTAVEETTRRRLLSSLKSWLAAVWARLHVEDLASGDVVEKDESQRERRAW